MTAGSPSAVGPYTITRELGRGGMGVVYLARDARLDRDVAIKALPEELAEDAERLARFEREARTLAPLNHPNIAGIYGVEEQDGAKYLVLEFVEGATLADMLDRGPLPVDDAIEYAVQIAAGVEAAHEAGVIHRDLKPGNIIITPDGQAKVLDFGLARTEEGRSSSIENAETVRQSSPAQHSPTIEGAILGTAAYMSPEQARGRKVDKRTDIWSFGVVLYEMLTGASPFAGETASDSIGAVLHKEVDLDRLPAQAPANVRRVLGHCLERDKSLRFRDIGDVRLELLAVGHESAEPAMTARSHRLLRHWIVATTAAIVTFGFAWIVLGRSPVEPARRIAHLSIDLPDERSLSGWPYPTLSDDGRRLVMLGSDDEGTSIFVRDIDDPMVRELPTTQQIDELSLAPDGDWVLYDANSMLYRMPIAGGPATPVCESPQTRGTAWGEDGVVVFAPRNRGPLHRVGIDGGESTPLYDLPADEPISDRHPSVLPSNRGVLFARTAGDFGNWGQTSLWVVDLKGGEPRQLVRNAANGRYISPGYLVFQREDTLMAAGFDLDRLEITTPETPVLRGLSAAFASAPAQFDLSRSGTLVYITGDEIAQDRRLVRVELDGAVSPLSERVGPFGRIVPSADGRLMAIEIRSNLTPDRIAIFEPSRDLLTPIRNENESSDIFPVWSPDGRWLAFASNRHGAVLNVYRYRVGSASAPERVFDSDQICLPHDWSSDGRQLLISSATGLDGINILSIPFDEEGNPSGAAEPLIEWAGSQFNASLSPDDRWMLFTSRSETSAIGNDKHEMLVVDVANPDRAVQVSTNGGVRGVWDPTLDRLYYANTIGRRTTVFSVDFVVREDGAFVPTSPAPLFDLDAVGNLHSMHMTNDGTAFICSLPVQGEQRDTQRSLRVVLNFDEQLKRLVAGSKR